ncbi:DNA repair and recombination protein RAD26 [Bimuria novae-zelandiae CBS 107.79]|uniref:DNA repair and recombination protein RAD26 n=1 Tax=Bimuria novae-zelandiae CBS 107.79 TaxID=1447943 RepID=A0A6A5VLP6_9PLEO|nr:DNA repair and recombination protein RAD26 [Bimuria novae-zelandiae CBS 107.79]
MTSAFRFFDGCLYIQLTLTFTAALTALTGLAAIRYDLPSDADEETRLKFLTTGTRDQDDLERDIGRQADQMLIEEADKRDNNRIAKVEKEAKKAQTSIEGIRRQLAMPYPELSKVKWRAEIQVLQQKLDGLDEELDTIQQRINDRHKAPGQEEASQDGVHGRLPNETQREFLIRTGKITPFSKIAQDRQEAGTLAGVLQDAEMDGLAEEASKGPKSHQNLMKPGFDIADSPSVISTPSETPRPRKKRRTAGTTSSRANSSAPETPDDDSDDAYAPGMSDRQLAALGDTDDETEDFTNDDDYEEGRVGRKRKAASKNAKKKGQVTQFADEQDDLAGVDDGNEKVYQKRLRSWTEKRSAARKQAAERSDQPFQDDENEEECYKAHPTEPDFEFEGGFKVPGDIFPALFDYQKIGVEWLWELYSQNVGGIVGDEMGLGKTIQAISFVAGLHYSKKITKPVIVVCPATVMKQWVNEFHRWWPALRVSILHSSGTGMLDTRREEKIEQELELRQYGDYDDTLTGAGKAAKKIVEKVKRDGHVLVTTYTGLQTYAEFLVPVDWETAILDEGHKIRNPDAAVTIHCKELRTQSRVILSGTPMQNNLTELWSLFDFVFPMRLGTLVNFRTQFEFPIKRGGYANASNLEFETAMQCAETLKDAVSPYLLQRFKVDVAADLPKKKEQVLFCKLTRQQREAYENFLNSEEMKSIAAGKRQMLFGIDYLRKICNHPDLVNHKDSNKKADYGAANKSGKMQVVKELLSLWVKGGHKTLLFAQHRIMLDILQKYLDRLPGINYRRMDGNTAIKNRQDMVDEFNNDPNLHVFLLTTKVGGLGVNLTGANRVIIYDPDWNPSTDIQARERSWRLGQKRDVEIYRLMCAGTIEEKIYHRQIFKQFLTNKVLKDPKQRQTFQNADLHDLFTLGSEKTDGETETGNIFRSSEVQFDKDGNTATATPQGLPEATAQSDLAAMAGIAGAETYRAPVSDSEDAPKDDGEEAKSDSRLMSSIFAKSGVHSVLEHDAIINNTTPGRKRKVQADPAFVQREARRQAALAAEQLKKDLEAAQNAPMGVPTFTGVNGELGRPTPRPAQRTWRGGRGGPSSSSVLSNLAARQGRGVPSTPGGTGTSSPAGSSRANTPPPATEMLQRIRNFMLTHGGVVPTKMLIDHFDHYCRSVPGRNELFKEALARIATMEKQAGSGRSKWKLKDEWRTRG